MTPAPGMNPREIIQLERDKAEIDERRAAIAAEVGKDDDARRLRDQARRRREEAIAQESQLAAGIAGGRL